MIELAGYRINAQIHKGSSAIVFRGVRERDERPVVIKQLNRKYPTPVEFAGFQREYDIMRSFDSDAIVRVYGLEKYRNTLVMVMEDFGGEAMARILPDRPFDLEVFLRLAIRIASAVSLIHQHHIIHKDIHPGNILWNPKTDAIKITDFSIASHLSRKGPESIAPGELEGTLAYISPEQTGRTNRPLDYRTDYYSLGVTLYQIATGRLPFASDDPSSLVHAHLARTPEAPREHNPDLPLVVSGIILKCLAKTADDRYQSGFGLIADLQQCLDRVRSKQAVDWFELGQNDRSRRFQIPGRLYGRDEEIRQILAAFQRVARGAKEMHLIAGNPGVGKSALAGEVQKSVTREPVYFICGKFNRLERRTPYSALIQALRDLAQQISAGGEETIAFWKTAISNALGNNAQLLLELIPELEFIIGKQRKPPDLPPIEAHNRFNLTFRLFIQAFSRNDHVLVVLLDDLHWADDASMKLIDGILRDAETERLFIIGTYRDTEVGEDHPLPAAVGRIRQAGVPVTTRALQPLTKFHVNLLIADTLSCPPEETVPLTEICFQKTAGNPFFLIQLLRSLYKDGRIVFEGNRGEWNWDFNEIRQIGITEDIVDLMMHRIDRLPEETKNVVLMASCIGMQFDAGTLALVNDMAVVEIEAHIELVVDEGLVVCTGETCRFSHDRIQQAAYGLLLPETRQAFHLKIGRRLYRLTPEYALDEAVFRIANQLNLASGQITDPGERRLLAELNLRAGRRAKASAAFDSAYNYLAAGIALLPENGWNEVYGLTHALFIEAAEAAFSCTDFEQMERHADAVIANARSLLDKVPGYDLKIQRYFAGNELLKVIEEGLHLLKLLGHRFPENPKPPYVAVKLLHAKAALAASKIDDLKTTGDMTDPMVLAATRIMRNLAHAAYGARPYLNPVLGFKGIRLSLKYGIAPESPSGFAGYAMVLCGVLGDIENGWRYGELALHLNERECAKRYRAQTIFLVTSMVEHWKTHLGKTLASLTATYKLGLELGDFEFATLSAFFYDAHCFFSGRRLETLATEMANYSRAIDQFKQDTHFYFNEMVRQTVLNLAGRAEDPCRLVGEAYDEAGMLPLHVRNNDMSAVFMVYFYKMMLLYLFERFEEALACSRKAGSHLQGMISTAWIPLYYFYDSLIRLAVMGEDDPKARKRHLKKVAGNQKKLKKWAGFAPMNHLHKWTLVEAERFRLAGNVVAAMDHYDRAVRGAGKEGYLQEEALANELAARFWLSVGKRGFAEHYMAKALHCYEIWGAGAKVDFLQEYHPDLLPHVGPAESGGVETTSVSMLSAVLDLDAVLKALQALSGEIVFDELMQKMMTVVIENAGAEKAQLLFRGENGWMIEAEGMVLKDAIRTRVESRKALPLAAPLSIIHYSALNGQTVVLSDAVHDNRFGKDAYVAKYRPLSVLCVPIFHQGNLTGLLYLENRLATGAFTADRLQMINILASQTAISLENARLYARLQASETKYRSIFENAVEGIFQVSTDGHFISANQAMAAILGFDAPEDLIAWSTNGIVEIFSDPDARHQIAGMLNSRGQIADFECAGRRRDDSEFWGSISIRAVCDAKGDLQFYEGALVDVTERKTREKAEQETREARAAANAKSEFLANMSHEIRTPMTAIVGLADILLTSGLTERQRESLHQIKGTSQSLMRIIDDVLDFSKIEAGKLTFDPIEFKLSDVLSKIACLFDGPQGDKEVEMLFSVPQAIPEPLIGDPLRLEQILINLTSNAFKFTHQGTVLIGVQPVQRNRDRVQLQFYVEDTGIGIPEDATDRLFDAFTQADGSITRKYGGTGLGLTISKKIVEMMQGRLWVERNDNPGSTFYFTVTLGCREDARRPPLKFPPAIAGKTVLIVEDNRISRHLLSRQIHAFGLQADACRCGERAIELLKTASVRKNYDLILIDSKMPGLDGVETARRIRAEMAGTCPPVALMGTGFASDAAVSEDTGIIYFLKKPVLPEPLYEMLLAVFSPALSEKVAHPEQVQVSPGILQRLKGVSVLLVEDNAINRMILVELIQGAGIHIDDCENGNEAVAAVGRKNYDAVLMDIQMPGMNGYETTRLIRENSRFKDLPIIAISAHAYEEHRQACRTAGMNDFIAKPIDINDVLTKLAANISREAACAEKN